MSGLPDANRTAFTVTAARLRAQGYTVLSPAILPDGLTEPQYMQICLAMVQCAGEMYLLKGRENSHGAQAEYALARKLGLPVRGHRPEEDGCR
ncbi:hypothetical protein CYD30_29155 [Kosakonia cowanii]|nr:hypothetical protein CYD30_29155 [Kosakonia cowanii]